MMTKIVDLLEQQVQWIAIGIGAIFLGLMVWWYVVNNPVTTQLAGTTVDLGSVDEKILDSAGRPLQDAMNSTQQIQSMGTPPQFTASFIHDMDLGRDVYQNETFSRNWLNAPVATGNISLRPEERMHGPVVALPTPPAPQMVGVLATRGEVEIPSIAGANPGIQQTQQAGPEDKNWVTVEGKISIAALAPELTQFKFPPANQTTEFLRVQVDREEKLPDGTWGNETIVQPPQYLGIPAWPSQSNPAAAIQYSNWAKTNVMVILQPPPFTVVKGNPWYLPSDKDTAEALTAPAGPAFDPTNLNLPAVTPEQKKARLDYLNSNQYKQLKQQQRNAAPPPPQMGPGGGGPGGPPGPAGMGGGDPMDRAVLAQANFGAPPPGLPPGVPPNMPPGAAPQPAQPAAPQVNASAAVQKYNAQLPQGNEVDPAKMQDVECWAFDDSVAPGKTYRYRFRYMVLNPAHSSPIAGTPDIARQLALISAYSEWSSPAPVSPAVNFFVASGISSGSRVNFKVYKWQNGEITTVNESDAPGDIIGAAHANANSVDYTTDWTMVGTHRDYDGTYYVMLVNPSGEIMRRNYHDDELDPLNRELKREVLQAQTANPAGNAAPNAQRPMQPMPPMEQRGGPGRF